jgi:hypothetical protein
VSRGLTITAYLALLLFGLAQGLLGAFFYAVGPDPLAAIGFDLAILATCLLGAWGTGQGAGAFVPAAGWFVMTFVLASGTGGGSVIVTASTAGELFLFGGAICALIGAVAGFTVWTRRRPAGPR